MEVPSNPVDDPITSPVVAPNCFVMPTEDAEASTALISIKSDDRPEPKAMHSFKVASEQSTATQVPVVVPPSQVKVWSLSIIPIPLSRVVTKHILLLGWHSISVTVEN